MNILVLQETDWLTRGPHTQHHIFERLSKNPSIKIRVIDYDIDKIQRSKSLIIKKQKYFHIDRTIKNSNVKIIRTTHIQVPFVRRISSLITNFFEILKIIRKNRPDIIVGYSITNGILGLILSKLLNIPFIFHYIDILHKLVLISYVQNLAKLTSRLLLKHADLTLILTKIHRNYVINEGAPPNRVKILPNGVSIENTLIDNIKLENLKKKYSISDDTFVIFFMGYLYDFAGLKEIIKYYHFDVMNGKLDMKFIILGDGGIYSNLKKYKQKIKANWVYLVGRVPYFEVTEYIQLADLCLLSFEKNEITKEILPIKVFEYLAMKKPILSNSLPGIVLEVGKDKGIIFTKDQEELIRKIGSFSNQKNELQEIGQKGYELVTNNYVWPRIINKFKRFVIDLIKDMRKIH